MFLGFDRGVLSRFLNSKKKITCLGKNIGEFQNLLVILIGNFSSSTSSFKYHLKMWVFKIPHNFILFNFNIYLNFLLKISIFFYKSNDIYNFFLFCKILIT